MIDPVNTPPANAPEAGARTESTRPPSGGSGHASGERAQRFSSAVSAWMSRVSGIRPNYAGQDDTEDADPEPIRASAPVIAPDVNLKKAR